MPDNPDNTGDETNGTRTARTGGRLPGLGEIYRQLLPDDFPQREVFVDLAHEPDETAQAVIHPNRSNGVEFVEYPIGTQQSPVSSIEEAHRLVEQRQELHRAAQEEERVMTEQTPDPDMQTISKSKARRVRINRKAEKRTYLQVELDALVEEAKHDAYNNGMREGMKAGQEEAYRRLNRVPIRENTAIAPNPSTTSGVVPDVQYRIVDQSLERRDWVQYSVEIHTDYCHRTMSVRVVIVARVGLVGERRVDVSLPREAVDLSRDQDDYLAQVVEEIENQDHGIDRFMLFRAIYRSVTDPVAYATLCRTTPSRAPAPTRQIDLMLARMCQLAGLPDPSTIVEQNDTPYMSTY